MATTTFKIEADDTQAQNVELAEYLQGAAKGLHITAIVRSKETNGERWVFVYEESE